MSGEFNGVQKLIMDEQPLAFYIHYFSHELNLYVTKSCEVTGIQNLIEIVGSIFVFLSASVKQTELLEKTIAEIKMKNNEGRDAGETYKKQN